MGTFLFSILLIFSFQTESYSSHRFLNDEIFNLDLIDKTPQREIKKIKTSINYPTSYKNALKNLETHIKKKKSSLSLFNYTLLSEENRGTKDLSEENIKYIMIQNLKRSILVLSQNELDKPYWPSLDSKTHFLFKLSYNMDGFQALVYFVADRKTGWVSIEEIAD